MGTDYDASSTKYVIKAKIEVDGVVENPDVIGAIFGQTEGLLGEELDLRELQKSGRIGRIQISMKSQGGHSRGEIIIPLSMDRVGTAILAASLETVDRIGPCSARITLEKIEDVRDAKRKRIIGRAVSILKNWEEQISPGADEITDEVIKAARISDIIRYGPEGLPAGSAIEDSPSIIVVEGRADVLLLLKYGYKNVIAVQGTHIPKTVIELSKRKSVTAFVDGDRGGELILKELLQVAQIDYIARAPEGKEVEDLSKKEVIEALNAKVPADQYFAHEKRHVHHERRPKKEVISEKRDSRAREKPEARKVIQKIKKAVRPKKVLKFPMEIIEKAESIKETLSAILLADDYSVIETIPVAELAERLQKFENGKVKSIIFDGVITQRLVDIASSIGVKTIIGARIGNITKRPINLKIATFKDLE